MKNKTLFEKGILISENLKSFFKGEEIYLNFLTDKNKELVNKVANVTFEANTRNVWHLHPGGQILIVIDGEGYYQEHGEDKQLIKAEEVITIDKNIIHWHGATESSFMSHLVVDGDSNECLN